MNTHICTCYAFIITRLFVRVNPQFFKEDMT
nr:MAG TPA: hypothetical protein [Caudoviricetes sp.]DAQ57650.1 MAG TPA: hypothetical protein [Caudoviricetes sp.]DAQ72959.1 MAG TPA: hypothetical protein [Bacteriophage sp.]